MMQKRNLRRFCQCCAGLLIPEEDLLSLAVELKDHLLASPPVLAVNTLANGNAAKGGQKRKAQKKQSLIATPAEGVSALCWS